MPQTPPAQVCPNGHAIPAGAKGRFCMQCGTALAAAAAPTPAVAPAVVAAAPPCGVCGGQGAKLDATQCVCPGCAWLRPLVPNYHLDCSAFQWQLDGTAMAALRAIGPLNVSARYLSDRVGRSWIEATFNAVKLGPKQLPWIYDRAVLAARILGMSFMPEVYISGERMWDAMTYGSDTSAFVVIGTALVNNFRDRDLLFLLAREMGHCRAGHALWKTVLRFLLGESGPRKGLSGGVLSLLSPTHLIGGALEMPLMAWARQAEITADRAGLLAVGEEAIARRVLLAWSLRSSTLYRQIDVGEWMAQEEDGNSDLTKLSEMATSSTPYIARRLKLMTEYARSPELPRYRKILEPLLPASYWRTAAAPTVPAANAAPVAGPAGAGGGTGGSVEQAYVRLTCPACRTAMRIPKARMAGKSTFNARCPNAQCAKVIVLRQQPKPKPPAEV